jgi:hypothetical protein
MHGHRNLKLDYALLMFENKNTIYLTVPGELL